MASELQGQSFRTADQQSTMSKPPTLGIGRGKARPEMDNDEPPLPQQPTGQRDGNRSTWTSNSFNNRSNDGSNNSNNNSGGFGSRSGGDRNEQSGFGGRNGQGGFGGGGNRGGFGDGGNRGGFGGGGDRGGFGDGGNRGGFGDGGNRGGFGGGGGRGGFESRNDGNPRTCYNCNQSGHMARECPQPRAPYRGDNNNRGRGGGGGGGFGSGSNRGQFGSNDDRAVNYNSGTSGENSSTSTTFSNSRNRTDYRQDNNREQRTGSANGRPDASNNYGGNYSNNQPRGGGGGFRGSRGGGFSSGNRGYSSGGGGDDRNRQNSFNNENNDHQGERPPPGFHSGGDRRFGQTSDNSDNQQGAQKPERYIPPPAPRNEDDIFGATVSRGENFKKYHKTKVDCSPPDKVHPIELYEEANFNTQILTNIRRANFEEPTPIQRYTIPAIQQRDDIMACAQTGSGKTAAFLLPIISNLIQYHSDEVSERPQVPSPLCLILSPTRELALQTEREARKFSYQTPVLAGSAIGGHDMFTVSDRLREGCHILSATTGRLKDMVEKGRISLRRVKYFVLDEADRMLDTGFEPDIRKLEDLGIPPKEKRCTSMFSATFPEDVQRMAKHFLRDDYIFLLVGIPGGANEDIAQTIEEVPQSNKKERLFQLLEENLKNERCLIFVERKRDCDYLGSLLSQKKFSSTTIHGDRHQSQRDEAVRQFTNGHCPVLVATSVAARGLDFPLIGYVVNYDLPDTGDFYIHRIGRTGRAGHLGKSISFFDPSRDSDRRIAPDLIAQLTGAGQPVPEFLQRFTDNGGAGFTSAGANNHDSRNVDMRARGNQFGNQHRQTTGASGGYSSAGRAEDLEQWDNQ